jgi:hypothetical protein
MLVLTLSHHVPAAKRAREGTLLGDASEATEKFGPLKFVLGSIPALFANREVCGISHSEDSVDKRFLTF